MAGKCPGSSPLTRGKRAWYSREGALIRLIPAHAGKTQPVSILCSSRRAHPRSRGENDHLRRDPLHCDGSSPLTRGKLPGKNDPCAGTGLIPAHAGKTSRGITTRTRGAAHPRSRGENTSSKPSCRSAWGSSPLTRGKPTQETVRTATARLIPAHAGKTAGPRRRPGRQTAHPRSRGENFVAALYGLGLRGSSPLTRGKLGLPDLPGGRCGLIPAHAGKTRGDLR